MNDSPRKRKVILIVVAIFFISLAKSLFTSTLGFGLLDEGEYLHIGLRILRGDLPYRDFFSYLPPLYSYWNSFAFTLFGVGVFSPRLLNSIIFSFIPVLFFLITRRFVPIRYAFIPALVIVFIEPSMEKIYYQIFLFSGLYLYFLNFKKQKTSLNFFSGLLLGLGSLFRLDIAGEFFAGMCLGTLIIKFSLSKNWFRESFGRLLSFSLGFIVPIGGLFLWLWNNDIIYQFTANVFEKPSLMTSTYALPFPKPWDMIPHSLDPKQLLNAYQAYFAYLILVTYGLFIWYFVKKRQEICNKNFEVVIIFSIALFTMPYMLGRVDLGHLIKGGIPFFLIGTYILYQLKFWVPKLHKILFVIPASLIIVGIGQIVWIYNFDDTLLTFSNGNILVNSQWPKGTVLASADTIERSIKFISDNSLRDDQVLVLPYMAGLYFLADRPSKTYEGNVFLSYLPNEESYVESLRNANIKVVVYDPINGPEGNLKRLKDYYPKIDQYIQSNFHTVATTKEGWQFMLPN